MYLKNISINIILFSSLLVCSFDAYSQINGKIVDYDTKNPLSNVNIYLSSSQIGTISDEEGYFTIKLDTALFKNDTIVFSHMGYYTIKRLLNTYKNNSIVYLRPTELMYSDSIEVFSERTGLDIKEIPHSIKIVEAEEIERISSLELSNVFKKFPSVRIEGNDFDGKFVQIRGSNSNEVNVYIDGVQINGLTNNNIADLSLIPIENISKIEVQKGANLLLQGNGAFGGVINIASKRKTNLAAFLKARVGSFENRNIYSSLTIPIISSFYVNYFGQYSKFNPEIEYYPNERFDEKTKTDEVETQKQFHDLSLNYYSKLSEIQARYFTYIFDYEKPEFLNSRKNSMFNLSFKGLNDLFIIASLNLNENRINRYLDDSNQNISDYNSERLNLKISKKFTTRNIDFQVLSEYYHDNLEEIAILKKYNDEFPYYKLNLYDNRVGAGTVISYNEVHDTISNYNWETFFSLRGDATASGHFYVTHALGLQINYFKHDIKYSPYINYGNNVRFPTLYESAFINDLQTFTSIDTTFTKLEPEVSTSFEFGCNFAIDLKHSFINKIDIHTAFFQTVISNKIITRPQGDLLIQSQFGENTTSGIEAQIDFYQIFNTFSATASFMKISIDDYLLYNYKPESNFSFTLNYLSNFGLYSAVTYFYEGISYGWYYDLNNDLQTQRIKPSVDIDLSIGYKWRIFSLESNIQASVNNLLDNSGYNYYLLRKRMYQVSFSLRY